MKKKIVFVFFTFFVGCIATAQNKKPIRDTAGTAALHHKKSKAQAKGKEFSYTRVSSANKIRRKDSLKAMNDPMTKLERPGHDSIKLSKPGSAHRRFSEDRTIQKKKKAR